MVRSPQWMRRSADGRGDLNGGMGSLLFVLLRGALCVSEMMSTLVLIVFGGILGVPVGSR